MENETQEEVVTQVEQKSSLHQVTPLSKYLALALFVILPFIGGWIGYTYAPEKVVEVESVQEIENEDMGIQNVEWGKYYTPYIKGIEEYHATVFYGEGKLHIITTPPMSAGSDISVIDNVDISSLEYLGDGWYKDRTQVIFVGYDGFENVTTVVTELDVSNFYLLPIGEKHTLGIDNNSVFFKNQRLVGIDSKEFELVEVEYSLDIVRDIDTVWFPEGNCNFGRYRIGTLDEIDTYQPPC